MYDKIWDALTSAGFDLYPLGKHTGECTKEFVVLIEGTDVETLSDTINKRTYEIWLYYPLGYLSKAQKSLDSLNTKVNSIKGLRRSYNDLPLSIDEGKKAYCARITCFINVSRK